MIMALRELPAGRIQAPTLVISPITSRNVEARKCLISPVESEEVLLEQVMGDRLGEVEWKDRRGVSRGGWMKNERELDDSDAGERCRPAARCVRGFRVCPTGVVTHPARTVVHPCSSSLRASRTISVVGRCCADVAYAPSHHGSGVSGVQQRTGQLAPMLDNSQQTWTDSDHSHSAHLHHPTQTVSTHSAAVGLPLLTPSPSLSGFSSIPQHLADVESRVTSVDHRRATPLQMLHSSPPLRSYATTSAPTARHPLTADGDAHLSCHGQSRGGDSPEQRR